MMEANPLAKWIICEHGLYSFILTKAICTLLVCLICFLLSKTKYKIAIYGVLVCQIILFLALNFWVSDNHTSVSLSDGLLHFYIKK